MLSGGFRVLVKTPPGFTAQMSRFDEPAKVVRGDVRRIFGFGV
ncbi:MAG: hypothetical protein JWO82_3822, partial [Akkermansiaceae bacterium]|nr:hypothetical protein [Akkermansiaceae bacterium]